jgi:hypothetical protein
LFSPEPADAQSLGRFPRWRMSQIKDSVINGPPQT